LRKDLRIEIDDDDSENLSEDDQRFESKSIERKNKNLKESNI
jgi:hypothetical protein